VFLNLSLSNLEEVDSESFIYFENLLTLDLSYNFLRVLHRNFFLKLKHLRQFILKGNQRYLRLTPGAFRGLQIKTLNLNEVGIVALEKNTFEGLNLSVLDISNNEIQEIQDFSFAGLYASTIIINNNPIIDFGKGLFAGVNGVVMLKTPAYKFCCLRPTYVEESSCFPYKDEFSSCEDLMRRAVLRVLLWIFGLLALSGNVFSIVYRLFHDGKRLKLGYGIFVTNLAAADMLMGIYMLTIAIADQVFRNRYKTYFSINVFEPK
jgi:leucine-rich repeat-containing G protein-coupled receptor 7